MLRHFKELLGILHSKLRRSVTKKQSVSMTIGDLRNALSATGIRR
jgi:hypothetical protein